MKNQQQEDLQTNKKNTKKQKQHVAICMYPPPNLPNVFQPSLHKLHSSLCHAGTITHLHRIQLSLSIAPLRTLCSCLKHAIKDFGVLERLRKLCKNYMLSVRVLRYQPLYLVYTSIMRYYYAWHVSAPCKRVVKEFLGYGGDLRKLWCSEVWEYLLFNRSWE